MRVKKVAPRYTVGTTVRVSLKKGPFFRSYNISHSLQRYVIKKVDTRRMVPLYHLSDERGNALTGVFYQHQLTPTNIEKYRGVVLKTRKRRGGRLEHLMHFSGYSSEWDEWVDAEGVNRV